MKTQSNRTDTNSLRTRVEELEKQLRKRDKLLTEHQRADELLRSIVDGTSSVVGQEFFRSLVRHLASALNMDFVILGELMEGRTDRIKTTAVWAHDDFAENFEYDLKDTPCDNVVGKYVCSYPSGVQGLFPNDLILVEMGAESYSGVPLFASDGSPLGVLVALHSKPMQEVSLAESILSIFAARASSELERRKKDEEMKVYGELVGHMVEGAALIRLTDRMILYTNQQFDELFGYERHELLGRPAEILCAPSPENGSELKCGDIVNALRKTKIWNGEQLNISKDGRAFWSQTSASIFESSRYGEVLLCLHSDITERKRLEKEILKTRKMELMGRLAGGVAHDFNNILSIITSLTDLATREAKTGVLRAYLDQIQAASDRAANLTRQLLIFSRNQPTETVTLDLNKTVAEMLVLLRHLTGENVRIKSDLAPGVMPVQADKSIIEQIVMNLVINAKDAMPGGGEISITTGSITIGAPGTHAAPELPPGKYVSLTVGDSGIGMSEETLKHIFEPFYSTKGTGKGIGLGLTVVHNTVKEYRGSITVESRPGEGTTFRLYLPASSSGLQSPGPRAATAEEEPIGRGERILIIEDEPILCRSVSLVLAKSGYKVFTAKDADEAADVFGKESGIDLVFSDVVLKGKSGVNLIAEFLTADPALKVVFASGYMDIDSEWPYIKEKGFRYLQKPYEIPELLRAIRECLDGQYAS